MAGNPKKVVYLCGPINGCNDSEAHDWREETKRLLGGTFQFLDPMRRDYRGREMEPHVVDEIVDGDKRDLDNTDILFAFCPKPSVGTSMEILYFWERAGRVVIVHPNPDPSPWLMKHNEVIFSNFDSAFAYLMEIGTGVSGLMDTASMSKESPRLRSLTADDFATPTLVPWTVPKTIHRG